MGYTYAKPMNSIQDADIKKYEGTVVSGCFMPYKKTYKEKFISRFNAMLNVILCFLILIAAVSYYIVTSSEMKLNKIRKETLALNDENMELQNHLDYLKSYSNVNQKMQSSNLVQKAEEVVEVPAVASDDDLAKNKNFFAKRFANNTVNNDRKIKWSLGY